MNIPLVGFKQAQYQLEILRLEDFYQRSQHYCPAPNELHRVGFHCLLQYRTAGTHTIDFEPYHYQSGDWIYIAPGQVHAYDFSHPLIGEMIIFTHEYYQQLRHFLPLDYLQHYRQQPLWHCCSSINHIVNNHLQLIKQQSSVQLPSICNQLALSNLLICISRNNQLHSIDPQTLSCYQKLLTLVQQKMTQTRHAQDYAYLMSMSYSKLNMACLKASGYTLKKTIDRQIILEAKRRLATENLNINQVSEILGFDETTNFIKFFNRHTSLSPRKFREQK